MVRLTVQAGAKVEDAIREAAVRGPLGRSQLYAHYSRTRNIPAGPPLVEALLHGNTGRARVRFTLAHPFMALFLKHRYKLQHGLDGRMTVGASAAYRHAIDEARTQGFADADVPDYTTATRIVRRELGHATRAYLERGQEGLRATTVRLSRDRADLAPLARIEADQHVFNWNVASEDGRRGRMTGVFAVDVCSGLLLGVQVDRTERAFAYRRLMAEVALTYGIRRDGSVLAIDNGAGAAYTNTTRSRRRWVGSKEEAERRPVGALERLGYAVDPQPPEHPWLKGTIEAANRLIDEELRAHPELPGTAYLGNAPGDRPAHGGTVAVPEAMFRRVVGEVVARINALPSPAPAAAGRSREAFFRAALAPDDVVKVEELYAASLCYPSEFVTVAADTGVITRHKNRYHSYEAAGLLLAATTPRNRKVEVFYDDGPGGLRKGVWAHRLGDNGFICHVPLVEERVADVERLREHKQARKAHTRAAIDGAKHAAAAVRAAPRLAAEAGIVAPPDPESAGPRTAAEKLAEMQREYEAEQAREAAGAARPKAGTGQAPAAPVLTLVRTRTRRASA